MEFVPSHLAILIACIYVVGVFLKNLNSVPDKYITIILMLFGIT
ncbi:phage holin family protein, partial [Clostridium butyricum]